MTLLETGDNLLDIGLLFSTKLTVERAVHTVVISSGINSALLDKCRHWKLARSTINVHAPSSSLSSSSSSSSSSSTTASTSRKRFPGRFFLLFFCTVSMHIAKSVYLWPLSWLSVVSLLQTHGHRHHPRPPRHPLHRPHHRHRHPAVRHQIEVRPVKLDMNTTGDLHLPPLCKRIVSANVPSVVVATLPSGSAILGCMLALTNSNTPRHHTDRATQSTPSESA